MKITQLALLCMSTIGLMATAHAAVAKHQSDSGDGLLILSGSAVQAGVDGEFASRTMDFSHFKRGGTDANGVYRVVGSDVPVPTHQGLGVWGFKQIGAKSIYFGEWAKESKDSAGNYTKQADPNTHTVFYTGDNADSSISTTGTASYQVSGLNNGQHYTGTYQADFGAKTITGSLSNGTDTFNLGQANINASNAKIHGNNASWSGANHNASGGIVNGQFFNQQQDVAGTAQFADRKHDIAFGGSK